MFLFYLIFWFLGLQDRIEFNTGAYIQNIYDAEGTKLRQIITPPSGVGGLIQTDYMGEVIYRNDTLISIAHDEGYSVPLDDNNTAFMPLFFYADHLGNTRLGRCIKMGDSEMSHLAYVLKTALYFLGIW